MVHSVSSFYPSRERKGSEKDKEERRKDTDQWHRRSSLDWEKRPQGASSEHDESLCYFFLPVSSFVLPLADSLPQTLFKKLEENKKKKKNETKIMIQIDERGEKKIYILTLTSPLLLFAPLTFYCDTTVLLVSCSTCSKFRQRVTLGQYWTILFLFGVLEGFEGKPTELFL